MSIAESNPLQAVGDWLQKFKNPEGLDIRAFYTDTFRDPSTQPDDRMLLYREPLYQSANSGSTVITTLVVSTSLCSRGSCSNEHSFLTW